MFSRFGAVFAHSRGRCKPTCPMLRPLGAFALLPLLAGFAATQQRPHLIGRIPAVSSRCADGWDPAASRPVGDRPFRYLEEQCDLARAQQPTPHAVGEHAVADQLLEQCFTVPNPLQACLLRRCRSPTLRARSVPLPTGPGNGTNRPPQRTWDAGRGNVAVRPQSIARAPRRRTAGASSIGGDLLGLRVGQ